MAVVLGALVPHPPIMIPEVGGKEAQAVRALRGAMKHLARELRSRDPDTIIVITPHAPSSNNCWYYGGEILSGDLAAFGAEQVAVEWPNDLEFLAQLQSLMAAADLPLEEGPWGELDHGALVPLHFLSQATLRSHLVVLATPNWTAEELQRLGQCINAASAACSRQIAVLASGDLSHRLVPGAPAGFHQRGKEFDRVVMDALAAGDLAGLGTLDAALIEAAGQCALGPLLVLAGALLDLPLRSRPLVYQAPFGVGYGVVQFTVLHPLVALAHQAIAGKMCEDVVLDAPDLPSLLPARAGAFVSIYRGEQLRGCIGTIQPTQATLADEVIHNAIAAATQDDRFFPLQIDELSDLTVSVDVLSELEPIASSEELDPELYGVVVRKERRLGLLLPALPGVNDSDQQLFIACQKAGLTMGDPKLQLYRFKVQRYG